MRAWICRKKKHLNFCVPVANAVFEAICSLPHDARELFFFLRGIGRPFSEATAGLRERATVVACGGRVAAFAAPYRPDDGLLSVGNLSVGNLSVERHLAGKASRAARRWSGLHGSGRAPKRCTFRTSFAENTAALLRDARLGHGPMPYASFDRLNAEREAVCRRTAT